METFGFRARDTLRIKKEWSRLDSGCGGDDKSRRWKEEEGEAERRVKGSEREGSETVMMDRVSRRGTPVVADSVFLWYKTGSEQATSDSEMGAIGLE